VQEEPENMGAWRFVLHNLAGKLPNGLELSCVARPESASPATGSTTVHQQEQEELLAQAFAG
jgi:2-oxoglutarate dehydrogenase complex dehydrogenase (E1) component-like enzyme